MNLQGEKVYLRALEPEDIDFLYHAENDTSYWEVSNTQTPYSKYILKEYLKNAHLDIFEAKQVRFVICTNENHKAVGMIDLFDFEPHHGRAGVGVLVTQANQGKGYASCAMETLKKYAFQMLDLHQIYANITADNDKSIKMFEKHGFEKIGVKKQWIVNKTTGNKDVVMYQLINQ